MYLSLFNNKAVLFCSPFRLAIRLAFLGKLARFLSCCSEAMSNEGGGSDNRLWYLGIGVVGVGLAVGIAGWYLLNTGNRYFFSLGAESRTYFNIPNH